MTELGQRGPGAYGVRGRVRGKLGGPAEPRSGQNRPPASLSCPQDSHTLVGGLRRGGPESAQALWDPFRHPCHGAGRRCQAREGRRRG